MATPAKIHRQVLTQQRASCAAAAAISEEPFAQQYKDIVAQCDAALAALPTDETPVEDKHVSALASLLAGSTALCTLLTNAYDTLKKGQPTAIASAITAKITAGELFDKPALATAVAAEITRLTTAGEIVPKATVAQMCSSAKTEGKTEGEAAVRAEITRQTAALAKITERKTALQTAAFPLPDAEALLGGTDEEFTARKTRAETRRAALQTAGFKSLTPELLGNIWKEDAEYAGFTKLIESIPALKSGGEPFAGGGASGHPGVFPV